MQTQHTKKYAIPNIQAACLVWSKTWAGLRAFKLAKLTNNL